MLSLGFFLVNNWFHFLIAGFLYASSLLGMLAFLSILHARIQRRILWLTASSAFKVFGIFSFVYFPGRIYNEYMAYLKEEHMVFFLLPSFVLVPLYLVLMGSAKDRP